MATSPSLLDTKNFYLFFRNVCFGIIKKSLTLSITANIDIIIEQERPPPPPPRKVQPGVAGLLAFLSMAVFDKLFPELSDLFLIDKSNNVSF